MPHIDCEDDRLACRCCGDKTDYDAFCKRCHHQYDKTCGQKADVPHCDRCGSMLDTTGACPRGRFHRVKEVTQ